MNIHERINQITDSAMLGILHPVDILCLEIWDMYPTYDVYYPTIEVFGMDQVSEPSFDPMYALDSYARGQVRNYMIRKAQKCAGV